MASIIERAPAKINLGLDIQGKREDGYHDLEMVMVSVDLCDYISVSALEEDCIQVASDCPKMPVNAKNDVFKAAQLIKENYQIKSGVSIFLTKKIPVCAGMGGGSSDAAATIRALNQLWDLKMSTAEMIALGMEIGSDVPYCIEAGCSRISGKGEIVQPIDGHFSSWVVLVKPDFGISTRTVFPNVDLENISRVNIDTIVETIEGNDYQAMIAAMGNALEDVSIARKPFIQKIKDKMVSSGADVALMTGSGPSVFALCQSEKQANRVVNSLKGFCKEVYKVRTL
ncbi:4-(cytidine 5'-diphospho)-2-C-methyl-D-erythritol kinase [Streptococcus pseudoporcinus]|uniref:Putative 4-diphosphocytidyl-2-C-methyl-D-erythritol kinase n=2 Tax=Streptococcus pseudoporcinus TaxID=361101 RepID=G5KA24_9STRE|nr:4-(cytidine 5'-diphospho)-2-C-methyl-D-erythritol kinase [Streptococcus pseudoporcinus]EFR43532.1 4-(cytidine 5'-diphospho)-2-C-methyl-D-erythritol kinase [Streptococcus pseudoporcinus SPIN 20026]EHI65063.1 4-(cytidine 5'-diphospho)-2-C-methyl-D-erythritol kinase [Streptococcus pseudoporcinus LQ 940-04]VEF93764.1 4-diphosphocytidyl-2-C-methyl-D-erythritol kinase [Streptococcus pseudoporcinus]VTS13432.1 4-diphosphocytidyl-2-C-methyl-D-erythritol kinase [Streptococcus pseudoporcinus]